MKTLVVYFSRKGYVRKVAEQLASECGGNLFELKTTERTEGILGFWWCGRFAMHRWGMPLASMPPDLEQYEKVILCAPVWVFSVCAPAWEFLRRAAGHIRAVDYVLVHYSFPMRYRKTVAAMDRALGITHGTFTSIVCIWGKLLRKQRFPA